MTRVIHFKNKKGLPNEVYIGRPRDNCKFHFGNPFSHKINSKATHQLPEGLVLSAFESWLKKENYLEIEPERRDWILKNLNSLKNKTLVCWCKPKRCHGDVYVKMLEGQKELF